MEIDQNLVELLHRAAGSGEVVTEEPMSRHTTFRIGGPADYFVTPHTKEEIRQVIQLCKAESLPFAVLGNGSNLLVGDKGFRGVVIQLFKNFSDITIEEEDIYAQSGALLVRLANQAAKQGLTGLEFASGIPGTLGGAVVMNAGAYGGEMKDVILYSDVVTEEGEFLRLSREELELGYRTSVIQKKHYFVLGAARRALWWQKAKVPACLLIRISWKLFWMKFFLLWILRSPSRRESVWKNLRSFQDFLRFSTVFRWRSSSCIRDSGKIFTRENRTLRPLHWQCGRAKIPSVTTGISFQKKW